MSLPIRFKREFSYAGTKELRNSFDRGYRYRCCGEDEQPQQQQPSIQYTQSPEYPEQKELFETIQKPYLQSQLKQYQDIFEPTSRQIGGMLQADLTQPFSLPEDVWNKTWQKAREKTIGEYEPISRQASERFAGSGALESSGQVGKYFGKLDIAKAKSIENLAVEQAIQEWTEKKAAKQTSYENVMRYLGYQPSFSVNMPTSQAYINNPAANSESGGVNPWATGAGALIGAGIGSFGGPAGTMIGGGIGSGIGSMF